MVTAHTNLDLSKVSVPHCMNSLWLMTLLLPQVISTIEYPLRFCELLQSCVLLELIKTLNESHVLTGTEG